MKLRNKTTGEIKEAKVLGVIGMYQDGKVWSSGEYATLEELYNDWEDYKPVKPLIKNRTEREAIRAWAKAIDELCGEISVIQYRIYELVHFFDNLEDE